MAKTSAVTPEQAKQIEAVLRQRSEVAADAWKLNLQLALRISDLLSVRYDDVQGKFLRLKEGKTGKQRELVLNTEALKLLKRRRKQNPEDVFVFQSKSNRVKGQEPKPISRVFVAQAIKEASQGVVEPGISVATHSARKTRARALLKAGTPIEVISRMLNHSSPAVTMTYLDITQDEVNLTYQMVI
ncbi:TPA: tyrosine-type recombinase/integrase [Klebsiella variicola]|uniref:tyrosine-type recombinase/integrase n=1 Tax=Klebsiella variicola TaxID=244366 RepID=UPI000D741825|nr:tyrosine-type recombinase/integrase [Klebsiella variicola]MBZ6576672.1 tyrosine-type recombinase/integrase [Klebsiella variicola]MBZ7584665.1 tyrosine-type recombinase/integrase [Klebsiella variicola]MCQ3874000.1 tyrosine-type recombinase/integrase [Klebsiella variicola]MCQ3910090.1 tyrosine-type recombinase/integrase [Klebsiella variicola]MDF7641856.1 tyrosine-type recombinase/integrase [Klebsiella variicola]